MDNWIVCILTILVTLLTKCKLRDKPKGTATEIFLLDFNLCPILPSISVKSNSLIKAVEKTGSRFSFAIEIITELGFQT